MTLRWIAPLALAALLWCPAAMAQEQQAGARSRALGGAGASFEEDPHSIWLNPAGLAAQPGGFAISYQSYTFYEEVGDPPDETNARPDVNDPVFIPSFLGVVFQVGSSESPQAVGLGLLTPYHLYFPFSGPNPTSMPPAVVTVSDQTFHRIRLSYAVDFTLGPAGETGFLTHLSFGLGVDLAITRLEATSFPGELGSHAHGFAPSGGGGVILGLFDNGQDLRISVGLSYQGPATFDLSGKVRAPSGTAPFLDWPQQIQVGTALALLERLPLKIYLEAQWTDWNSAAKESTLAGIPDFRSTLDFSVGVEYRVGISTNAALLPRAGIRRDEAPWTRSNPSQLPAWGDRQLFITTRSGAFTVISLGIGLSWGYREGTQDSLDLAFEFGGDAPGLALSYVYQF